jgi:hypothetical protein
LPDLAVLIPCLLPSWYRLVIQGVQLKGRQETPPTADLKPCNTRLRYGALDFGSPIPVCAEPPNGSSPAISSPLGRHRQETTTNFKTCITRLISGSGLWTLGRLFPYVPNLRTGSSPAISSPLGRHLRQLFRDFRGSDGHPVYTVTDANISVKVFFALLTVWNTAMYCMYVRTYLPPSFSSLCLHSHTHRSMCSHSTSVLRASTVLSFPHRLSDEAFVADFSLCGIWHPQDIPNAFMTSWCLSIGRAICL